MRRYIVYGMVVGLVFWTAGYLLGYEDVNINNRILAYDAGYNAGYTAGQAKYWTDLRKRLEIEFKKSPVVPVSIKSEGRALNIEYRQQVALLARELPEGATDSLQSKNRTPYESRGDCAQ